MRAAYAAAQEILADEAAADPTYRTIHEAFRSWQKESSGWFDLAEGEYARFMSRQFSAGGGKG
jgi:TRAP-type mannitol/chloroaromatic compound transport system substrate-binding protein